jgi:hypothetical protein
MPIHVDDVLLHAMSGTELSRVRTEFRLRLPEPINKSPLESRGADIVMQSSEISLVRLRRHEPTVREFPNAVCAERDWLSEYRRHRVSRCRASTTRRKALFDVVEAESWFGSISRQATTGDQTISTQGMQHGVEVASCIVSPARRHLAPQCALVVLLREAPSSTAL